MKNERLGFKANIEGTIQPTQFSVLLVNVEYVTDTDVYWYCALGGRGVGRREECWEVIIEDRVSLPVTLSNWNGKLRPSLVFCPEKNNMNQKSMQIPLTQNTEKIPSFFSGDEEPKA